MIVPPLPKPTRFVPSGPRVFQSISESAPQPCSLFLLFSINARLDVFDFTQSLRERETVMMMKGKYGTFLKVACREEDS